MSIGPNLIDTLIFIQLPSFPTQKRNSQNMCTSTHNFTYLRKSDMKQSKNKIDWERFSVQSGVFQA